MNFIWIDWIVLAVIGFGVWRGVQSGFFQQAASLVGLVGGFLLAAHLMPAGGQYLSSAWGLDPRIAPLVAFIGMFLLIVLAVILGARFFEYLVGVLHIGFLDRAMGGVFGALQTVLLLSVLFWFTGQFDWPSQQARSRSALIEPIEAFAGSAWDWTRRMWPSIDEFYDRMGEEIEQRAADSTIRISSYPIAKSERSSARLCASFDTETRSTDRVTASSVPTGASIVSRGRRSEQREPRRSPSET